MATPWPLPGKKSRFVPSTRPTLSGAGATAESLRESIASAAVHISAELVPVTVSLGVATAEGGDCRTATEVVEAADQALYRAKAGGRNRVEVA